jgi:hypothetical protein
MLFKPTIKYNWHIIWIMNVPALANIFNPK